MQPLVSIVMPTYNRLEFLAPTINSVLAQTFHDWELIVADDGSNDATKQFLRSLGDPRIKILWLQHTGRPSLVTNVAVREARGNFVAFLDSDDLWLPEKLELQLASLGLHPNRQWSYTRFSLIDTSGRTLPSTRDRDRPADPGWILEKLLAAKVVIAQPSVLVSRELFTQLGGFDEKLLMCYDDDLWLRFAERSEIDSVDKPLTLVRRHSQHSGSDSQAWRDRRRVFEKALNANRDERLAMPLRKLRAQMSAGLAKSHARYGRRLDAVGALFACVPHTLRFPSVWLGAAVVVASRFAPRALRSRVIAVTRRG